MSNEIRNAVLINEITPDQLEKMIDRILDKRLEEIIASMQENLDIFKKNKDGYYTAKETAKILRVSVDTLNKWTKIGIITPRRVGTSIRYTQGDIDKALKGGKK